MNKQKDMIFGLRPVIEAIEAGKTFDKIFMQKGLQGELAAELRQVARTHGLGLLSVPAEKLNRLTRKNHQGVVAFISPIEFADIDHIIDQCFATGRNPLIVYLDRITDVRNFGAIVRTAEGAGADAVMVPLKGAAQISGDAMKTSAGALSLVPVCRSTNPVAQLKNLQQSGLMLVACTEKSTQTIYEVPLHEPVVIVMGAEDSGIDPAILQLCDYRAAIPMRGQIGSLNVATATGIILYEALRQRLQAE